MAFVGTLIRGPKVIFGACVILFCLMVMLIHFNYPYYKTNQSNLETFSLEECCSPAEPKDIWEFNKNRKLKSYADKRFLKNCTVTQNRKNLFYLFKYWMKFAAIHNVPWFAVGGTLLGALRHRDIIPWDSDIDLGVPKQYESVIRKYSTPKKKMLKTKYIIIPRPNSHCALRGTREDCKGNEATAQRDVCSFCQPLARVIHLYSGLHIDIYLFDFHYPNSTAGYVFDESFSSGYSEIEFFPTKWLCPLWKCEYMNLAVPCFQESIKYLTRGYGSIKNIQSCSNGKWIPVKSNK